jgi:hypothetical protein
MRDRRCGKGEAANDGSKKTQEKLSAKRIEKNDFTARVI